jgi:hypothetical protein
MKISQGVMVFSIYTFIFAGAVRITLHIFRTTFALLTDAVPLTMAAYKSLLTSRRYHRG